MIPMITDPTSTLATSTMNFRVPPLGADSIARLMDAMRRRRYSKRYFMATILLFQDGIHKELLPEVNTNTTALPSQKLRCSVVLQFLPQSF
jgi:hypothetical protein